MTESRRPKEEENVEGVGSSRVPITCCVHITTTTPMDVPPESSHYCVIPQLTSSQSDAVQNVDVLALLMTPSAPLSKSKQTNEELIAQRTAKRATKKAEVHEKAESYKRAVTISFHSLPHQHLDNSQLFQGDSLYHSKNYKAAQSRYLEAIQLVGNIPEYYISLAAAYRKLTW